MDILIKSFNRPYYLDKCLKSIYEFIEKSNYKITILDDGTPQKYLNKILSKYPEISIIKSDFYKEKSNAIENNLDKINCHIPIKLWIESVINSTDNFLLLEDDMWFTKPVNLDDLDKNMLENNLKMLKLYWLGNSKLIPKNYSKKLDLISIYKPNLYIKNPILYYLIFRVYRFKTRKISKLLNIYSDEKALNYYTIFATAGAIFSKDYFLELFKNHKNSVDEGLQLYNAVELVNKNLGSQFGHTNTELLKTGFASSATNKDYENIYFDMFLFNKSLNEAWFKNEFESINNIVNDLNYNDIETILNKANNPKSTKNEWQKWVAAFKNQYIDFGCKID